MLSLEQFSLSSQCVTSPTTCTYSTSFMSGLATAPSTTSSSKRSSGFPTSGPNLPKSKYLATQNYYKTPMPLLKQYVVTRCFPQSLNRCVFGCVAAAGSTAPQLAFWQYIYGGTWSPQEYADWNSFKHLVCAIIAFTPTCGLVVPFENARRAYYADKTWPIEMRRNYTSPTQALFRIPFEEGPGYLMKGGFPLALN